MPIDLLSDSESISQPKDLLADNLPNQVNLSGSNSPVIDQINAIGGGAQQTLANSVQKAGHLVADVLTDSKLTPYIRSGSDTASQALQPPGFVQEAQQQNPGLSTAGNMVGGVMAMGASGLGASALASKGIISSESASYLSNAAISSAMSGDGLLNRTVGVIGGLAITKAANVVSGVIGNTISSLGKSKIVQDGVKSLVGSVNNAYEGLTTDQAAMQSTANMWNMASHIRDQLYSKAVSAPGEVRLNQLARLADNHLETSESIMTAPQRGAIQAISKQADTVRNLNDAHELTKAINNVRPLFLRSGTAPQVIDAYKGLQTTANNLLTSNAELLGVGEDLALAKNYNREVIAPLQDFGADKIARGEISSDGFLAKYIKNPTGINPSGSPEKLGSLLNAMDDKGKDIITNNFIQRAIRTSKAGADGIAPEKGSSLINEYLSSYGKYLGVNGQARLAGVQKLMSETERAESSASQAAFGMINRIPVLGSSVKALQLLGSQTGQKVLEFIGNHPSGVSLAKTLSSGIAPASSALSGSLVNTYSPKDSE